MQIQFKFTVGTEYNKNATNAHNITKIIPKGSLTDPLLRKYQNHFVKNLILNCIWKNYSKHIERRVSINFNENLFAVFFNDTINERSSKTEFNVAEKHNPITSVRQLAHSKPSFSDICVFLEFNS